MDASRSGSINHRPDKLHCGRNGIGMFLRCQVPHEGNQLARAIAEQCHGVLARVTRGM